LFGLDSDLALFPVVITIRWVITDGVLFSDLTRNLSHRFAALFNVCRKVGVSSRNFRQLGQPTSRRAALGKYDFMISSGYFALCRAAYSRIAFS